MNDYQQAKLDSYTNLETVLDAHPEPLDAFPAAAAPLDRFRDVIGRIRQTVEAQLDYVAKGPEKEAALRDLVASAVPIAQAVAAHAGANGDPALARQMDLHASDFTHASDQEARALAALVLSHATAAAAALDDYGVTAALLTTLQTRLAAFTGMIGQPQHAISERKRQTEALDALFAEMDDLLTGQLDRIVEMLRGTAFYGEYQDARRIDGR